MSNHLKSCRCKRCITEISWFIRWSFRANHAWLGMYQAKVAGELGWIDHALYAYLFWRLVNNGDLIEIAAQNPNGFPVYMHFKLCGARFEPYPGVCLLIPEKGDALLCQPSTN